MHFLLAGFHPIPKVDQKFNPRRPVSAPGETLGPTQTAGEDPMVTSLVAIRCVQNPCKQSGD